LLTVVALDPFSPLFGLTSLADLYAFAPGFIDSLLYLVFFISLSLFSLSKFYRDKGDGINKEGKMIAVVLGIALAIAASIWSTTSGFSLANLSFLAAFAFLGFIFLFLHNLLKMFLGKNAKFATYILIYFIAFLTFPAFGDWLNDNAGWSMLILSLLFLISLIVLIAAFLKGLRFGGSESSSDYFNHHSPDYHGHDDIVDGNDSRAGNNGVDGRTGNESNDTINDADLNISEESNADNDPGKKDMETDESGKESETPGDGEENPIRPETVNEKIEIEKELSEIDKLLKKPLRIPTKKKLKSLNVGQFASDFIFSKSPKLGREFSIRIPAIIEHLTNLRSELIRNNYPRTHPAKFKEFEDSFKKIEKAKPRINNLKRIMGDIKQAEDDRTIIRYAKGAYLDIKEIIKVNKLKTLDKQFYLIFNRGYSNSKRLNQLVWKKIGHLNSEQNREFLEYSDNKRKSILTEIKDNINDMDVLEKEFTKLYEEHTELQDINLINGRTWKKLFQDPKKLSFIMENGNRFATNRISRLFKFFDIAYKGALNLDIELRKKKKTIKDIRKDF
jgi:flagellar biosynthesis/type III secretory pathway chaperone